MKSQTLTFSKQKIKLFLILFIAICSILDTQAQSSRSKKVELVVPGKQKVRKADFDSVWKFADFDPLKKYYADYDYSIFLNAPKKIKDWGTLTPLINYMMSNQRKVVNFCAIYAINPFMYDAATKKRLSEKGVNESKKAMENFFNYLSENDIPHKSTMQIAEVDSRYWYGNEFYNSPKIKEDISKKEVLFIGLLVHTGKRESFFSTIPVKEIKRTEKIKFFPDSDELLDSYKKTIKELSTYLLLNEDLEITVIGYTDNRKSEKESMELSLKRAETVRDELAKNHILKYRVEVIGEGASNPVGDNNTHEGMTANNRVEIIVR